MGPGMGELMAAGHCPPIVVRARGSLGILGSAGLPVGLVIGAEPSVPYWSIGLHWVKETFSWYTQAA
jgi:serine phosphatase RsbU (regulator of sigma subunit)